MTQASLDAMRANPAGAKAGLAKGIAASLDGIDSADVTILSTTPDLGFRRLASERHLQGVELQVDFSVESAEFSVESLTNAVSAVSPAALTGKLTDALDAQGITVEIT